MYTYHCTIPTSLLVDDGIEVVKENSEKDVLNMLSGGEYPVLAIIIFPKLSCIQVYSPMSGNPIQYTLTSLE